MLCLMFFKKNAFSFLLKFNNVKPMSLIKILGVDSSKIEDIPKTTTQVTTEPSSF